MRGPGWTGRCLSFRRGCSLASAPGSGHKGLLHPWKEQTSPQNTGSAMLFLPPSIVEGVWKTCSLVEFLTQTLHHDLEDVVFGYHALEIEKYIFSVNKLWCISQMAIFLPLKGGYTEKCLFSIYYFTRDSCRLQDWRSDGAERASNPGTGWIMRHNL